MIKYQRINMDSKSNYCVCLISCGYNGGFKTFVDNIMSLLKKNDVEVHSLFLNDNVDTTNNNNDDIIHIESLPKRKRPKKHFFYLRFSRKLKNNNNELENLLYDCQLIAALKVLKIKGTIDLSKYDCVISTEEIFCNYFLINNVIAKKKVCYVHPDYAAAHFNKRIDSYFFKKADYIFTPSNTNANSLKSIFRAYNDKVIGLPNPLDIKTIIKKSQEKCTIEINEGKSNLITVCRLDNTSKALDRLLQIALSCKNDHLDFVWRIVGDGPYRKTMEKFIVDNNLQRCVLLLGHLKNPIPLVAKSSIFILQSYYEGYPYSVLESLVVNTPVLVSNYPAAHEQVDNEYGIIVDNNINSLTQKIKEIIQDSSIISRLKDNLKKEDKSKYENIDSLLNIIRG